MASEVLKGVADDILAINNQISEAEELISAMKEAGEDTAALEADLNTLRIRKNKWERMLRNRGVMQ